MVTLKENQVYRYQASHGFTTARYTGRREVKGVEFNFFEFPDNQTFFFTDSEVQERFTDLVLD